MMPSAAPPTLRLPRRAGVFASTLLFSLGLPFAAAPPGPPGGVVAVASTSVSLQGQASSSRGGSNLAVSFRGGEGATLPVATHRGYPALPASALASLGWSPEVRDGGTVLRHRTGIELAFTPGSPFFRWEGRLMQLAAPAYRFDGELHVPLQLTIELFPGLLPRAYSWDRDRRLLRVEETRAGAAEGPDRNPPLNASATRVPAPRLVVIDPGHGGDDPGAMGPGGVREKDVALAVGLALARELGNDPSLEVRLTREDDGIVPIWERGERATRWKGDRTGVFVSIHANALPGRPEVRGFETYFLSEARTEHERRVAAVENAPLLQEGRDGSAGGQDDPLLAAILRDLRTFDHQHWSALFAELVQGELSTFHPGPDRGVKQGPFAVITNALMPSVLVEVGFVTNPDEARLLAQPRFHQETARALARAIRSFFLRYPVVEGS